MTDENQARAGDHQEGRMTREKLTQEELDELHDGIVKGLKIPREYCPNPFRPHPLHEFEEQQKKRNEELLDKVNPYPDFPVTGDEND